MGLMTKDFKMAYSFIENDGMYEMNFNYEDKKGIKINRDFAGNDLQEMIRELTKDIDKELTQQRLKLEQAKKNDKSDEKVEEKDVITKLKQTIKELKEENVCLKSDMQILQQRADDAVNKLIQMEEEKQSEEDELISLFKQFGFKPVKWR
jgi:chromosome segregation ATPase